MIELTVYRISHYISFRSVVSKITANIQRDSFSIFQLRDDFSIWRRIIQSCWMFWGFLEQWRQVFSAAFQFPTIGQHLVLLLAGEKPDDNRPCCGTFCHYGTFCRAAMPARFVTNEVVTNRADIFLKIIFTWILVHVILYVSLVCVYACVPACVRAVRACVKEKVT